jgi:hypothetical protein
MSGVPPHWRACLGCGFKPKLDDLLDWFGLESPPEPPVTGPNGHDPDIYMRGPCGPTGGVCLEPFKVIAPAEQVTEFIEITELTPTGLKSFAGQLIKPDNALPPIAGKTILPDSTVTPYPKKETWWWQGVSRVLATIQHHLFAYFCEARERNVCIIRGAPANLDRQPTRKLKAGRYNGEDRGDHGFLNVPTKLISFDLDGVSIKWRDNP